MLCGKEINTLQVFTHGVMVQSRIMIVATLSSMSLPVENGRLKT